MKPKTVGVIGGLGPLSTIEYLRSVYAKTPAPTESDHIRLIVDSNPRVPDINAAISGSGATAAPLLQRSARILQSAGADFIVLICNAAHFYAPEIRSVVSIPFLDMVEETCRAIPTDTGLTGPIGVIATDGLIKTGLYSRALAAHGHTQLTLNRAEQEELAAAIGWIKAGEIGPRPRSAIERLINQLAMRGAQCLILACSEIPLAIRGYTADLPLLDPCEILAVETVRMALGDSRGNRCVVSR